MQFHHLLRFPLQNKCMAELNQPSIPSEGMKNYRKSLGAAPPSKICLLLLFLLIMFMLQGKTTPNTYMLLKINAFQLLRWKNES